MGLSPERFRELARRTRSVVHAGAQTNWSRDPAEIARANRVGTESALELAALAEVPIHYVGTAFMSMAGGTRLASGRATEAVDMDRGIDAYLASKAASDELVATSGLPHTIVRPSYIVGDSNTGQIARFQGLHRVVSLALRGMVPVVPIRPDAHADFVPQDLVARVLATLVENDANDGEVWVTAGERAMRAAEFLDIAHGLAQELGLSAHRPRLVPPGVVDRLIRPVFIAKLPKDMRRQFDDMLAMTAILAHAHVLPSSLDELEARYGVDLSFDQRTALRRSLVYWAEVKGLVPAQGAAR
jgi:thioester reductase-like protein